MIYFLWNISKFYQSTSEMLNLHGEYAQYGHKASFYEGFINKFWKDMLVAHLPWKYGNVKLTAKFLWYLDILHFNVSALDQHQSLFWRFCQCLICTIAVIELSDPVIFSGPGDCSVWKIFNYSNSRQKLFWSLWLLRCKLYGAEWCQILPIVPVKILYRSRIYETYSFSAQSNVFHEAFCNMFSWIFHTFHTLYILAIGFYKKHIFTSTIAHISQYCTVTLFHGTSSQMATSQSLSESAWVLAT